MIRVAIAGGVFILGIFMLPASKALIQDIAGIVSTGMADQKGGAFIQLVADHGYLVAVLTWLVVIVAILFVGRGDENEVRR